MNSSNPNSELNTSSSNGAPKVPMSRERSSSMLTAPLCFLTYLVKQALAGRFSWSAPKIWLRSLKGLLQVDEALQLQAEEQAAPYLEHLHLPLWPQLVVQPQAGLVGGSSRTWEAVSMERSLVGLIDINFGHFPLASGWRRSAPFS